MFQITERAAQKVIELLARNDKPDGYLRITIVPGGCSGLEYDMEVTDTRQPTDQQVALGGARVLLDGRSALYLEKAELAWKQSLMKSGFEIVNPDAKSKCECGESFSLGGSEAVAMGESVKKCD